MNTNEEIQRFIWGTEVEIAGSEIKVQVHTKRKILSVCLADEKQKRKKKNMVSNPNPAPL